MQSCSAVCFSLKKWRGVELADFVERYADRFPHVRPDRYGWCEPIRFDYEPARFRKECLEGTDSTFLWRSKKPWTHVYTLRLWREDLFQDWYVKYRMKDFREHEVVEHLEGFSVLAECDLAMLHAFSSHETSYGEAFQICARTVPDRERNLPGPLSVPEWLISLGLPTLTWVTVFGPMYVRHFGRERLMSVPAPVVRETEGGGVLVQLSESYRLIEDDWDRFHATREAVIDHLGRDSFQRPREAEDPPRRTRNDLLLIPAERVPQELVERREATITRFEEAVQRELEQTVPEIRSLDEVWQNPGRFEVVEVPAGDTFTRIIIDRGRQEMLGIADPDLLNEIITRFTAAGGRVTRGRTS